MSFRTSPPVASSPFDIVLRSCLQQDGLPFADALTAEQMAQACEAEGVSFGDDPQAVYTLPITLWAMLSQGLFTGEQRSCVAAVVRVAVYYALLERVVSTNTGAYCRARAKVGEGVVKRLAEGVAERCEAAVPEDWKWLGMTVRLADGTTHSMPDTPENQAEYPQYDSLPGQLEIREVHVTVGVPGFRTESLVVVTSLLDAEAVSAEDLADLYRQRWLVELHLRDIKSNMQLDVLRCQTPEMVRQELWTGLLAYNLVRQSLLQSTAAHRYYPHQLSFTATLHRCWRPPG